jgi:hypothetical protein
MNDHDRNELARIRKLLEGWGDKLLLAFLIVVAIVLWLWLS